MRKNEFIKYWIKQSIITVGLDEKNDIVIDHPDITRVALIFDYQTKMIYNPNHVSITMNQKSYSSDLSFEYSQYIDYIDIRFLFYEKCIVIQCHGEVLIPKQRIKLVQHLPFKPLKEEIIYLDNQYPVEEAYSITFETPRYISNMEKTPLIFTIGPMLTMALASSSIGFFNAYRHYMDGKTWLETLPSLLLPMSMLVTVFFWYPMQRRFDHRKQKKKYKEAYALYQRHLLQIQENYDAYIKQLNDYYDSLMINTFDIQRQIKRDVLPLYRYRYESNQNNFIIGDVIRKIPIHYQHDTMNESYYQTMVDDLKGELDKKRKMPFVIHEGIVGITKDDKQDEILKAFLLQILLMKDKRNGILLLTDEKWLEKHVSIFNHPHLYNEGKRHIITNPSQQYTFQSYAFVICTNTQYPIKRNPNQIWIQVLEDTTISKEVEYVIGQDKLLYRNDVMEIQSIYLEELVSNFENIMYRLNHHLNQTKIENLSFSAVNHIPKIHQDDIVKEWKKPIQTKIVLGYDNYQKPIEFDIDEAGDGPHGIIVGMTGSGKSELLCSFVLSLLYFNSPKDIQVVFIDFKGGSMSQMFDQTYHVPHVVGSLSDLNAYHIEKVKESLKIECKKREKAFHELSKTIKRPINDLKTYLKYQTKDFPSFARILIIVDEFAELKFQQPQFIDQLISIARIGRSLGIHLILSMQKSSGIINDQIEANCSYRICLKVSSKQDAKEIVYDDLPASFTCPGEFYLYTNQRRTTGKAIYTGDAIHNHEVLHRLNTQGMIQDTYHNEKGKKNELTTILKEIATISYDKQEPLWLPSPHARICSKDRLYEIGVIDDYFNHRYESFDLSNALSYVFVSTDTEELEKIYKLVEYSLTNAKQEMVVIDGNQDCLPEIKDSCWVIVKGIDQIKRNHSDWLLQLREGLEKGNCHMLFFTNLYTDMPHYLLSLIEKKVALYHRDGSDIYPIIQSHHKYIQEKGKGYIKDGHVKQIVFDTLKS